MLIAVSGLRLSYQSALVQALSGPLMKATAFGSKMVSSLGPACGWVFLVLGYKSLQVEEDG